MRFLHVICNNETEFVKGLLHFECDSGSSIWPTLMLLEITGHQHGARGHQVAREDHVARPRACLKNGINL